MFDVCQRQFYEGFSYRHERLSGIVSEHSLNGSCSTQGCQLPMWNHSMHFFERIITLCKNFAERCWTAKHWIHKLKYSLKFSGKGKSEYVTKQNGLQHDEQYQVVWTVIRASLGPLWLIYRLAHDFLDPSWLRSHVLTREYPLPEMKTIYLRCCRSVEVLLK